MTTNVRDDDNNDNLSKQKQKLSKKTKKKLFTPLFPVSLDGRICSKNFTYFILSPSTPLIMHP